MSSLTIVIPTTGRETLQRAEASAWAAADEVIVIHDNGRYGCPGLARNAAADRVKTTHVGFLDDDDVLVPEVYRRVTLDVHPAAAMVIHTMWTPDVGPVPRPGWPIDHGNVGISFTVQADVFRAEPFIAGPPITMRGEDFELVRRFMDKRYPVVLSQEVAYVARPEEVRWPLSTAT